MMKPHVSEPEVLIRKQAADFLQLSLPTLNYLVQTNQIPFSRVGKRSVRFRRSRLLKWLDEQEGIEFRKSGKAIRK